MQPSCDAAKEGIRVALLNPRVSIATLTQLIISAMEICLDSDIQEALGVNESSTNRAVAAYHMARTMFDSHSRSDYELPVYEPKPPGPLAGRRRA